MVRKAIRDGDIAVGHTDIQGNPVTGTVTTASKLKVSGVDVARSGDIVHFPSHAHALDTFGSPTNFQTHNVPIVGTAKLKIQGQRVALHGDTVAVADIAGPNATLVGTQDKLFSNP